MEKIVRKTGKDKISIIKGLFVLILTIIIVLQAFLDVRAKELCDCYVSCTDTHPRKVNTKVKNLVKVRDGYDVKTQLDIDHKLPLCLGGTNDEDNLQAIPGDVHRLKTEHDMLLLYYVKNCLMTIDEAQNEALNYSIKQ
jgi:hypothetical protein